MGQVYRAYDTATNREVAVKILPPNASNDSAYQQRFRREANTAAGLSEPHIIPIHGFGEIDGRLYLDMRLIEGQDLAHILRDGPLDPARAVDLIGQVAEALNAAHAAGLVHRDVKPSNILITSRGFAYLIDFGIAQAVDDTRLTSTGLAIGTFAYMAPERISASQSGPSSDIYALACVLYECLIGQAPFGTDSVQQQIAGHLMTPPPAPSKVRRSVPPGFDVVIAQGMAKDPNARYRTALELADAARMALAASALLFHEHSGYQPTRPGERHPTETFPSRNPAATQPSPGKAPPFVGEWPPNPVPGQVPTRAVVSRPGNRTVWAGLGVGVAVLALAAVLVFVIGRQSGGSDSTNASRASLTPHITTATTPFTATSPKPASTDALPAFVPPTDLGANCRYTPTSDPAAKPVEAPRQGQVPTEPAAISMTLTTNQGPLGIQLDNAKAPCTVNNFVSLAQKGYYDNTSCHRLTTAGGLYVLQCGDPKGDGTGGPGYQFADEYPVNQYRPGDSAASRPVIYPRGTLAMANAGPGTNGSQFFIVYKDSELPPNYTIFGKVDEKNIDVLDKIAEAGTVDGSPDGKPKTDVVITSARLD